VDPQHHLEYAGGMDEAQGQLNTPESQRVFHKLSAGLRLKPGQGSGRSAPTNARWGCSAKIRSHIGQESRSNGFFEWAQHRGSTSGMFRERWRKLICGEKWESL
jgi:hypothetical protein